MTGFACSCHVEINTPAIGSGRAGARRLEQFPAQLAPKSLHRPAIRSTWSIQDASGATIAIEGIGRDISERVAAEQAINDANNQLAVALENARQLTPEAQAADRLKSQILAHTSHELRTPLTSILGALGLLESRVGDDPVQRRKLLALTRTSASNLLNIVTTYWPSPGLRPGRMPLNRPRS